MPQKDDELLKLAREEYSLAMDAEGEIREAAREDISIYDGIGIWPEQLRRAREGNPRGPRPCLNVSDLPPRVHQITNDVRQNPPSIKTRPVDNKADIETAEVFDGVIRHIEQQSEADIAYSNANFYQVVGGYGYFRIIDGYSKDDTGQQELFIRQVPNPFAVYFDPYSACPAGSDARFAFITEEISRKEFEREYPGVDLTGWEEAASGDQSDWVTENSVRVAEWMRIEKKTGANVIKAGGEEYSEDDYWALEDRPVIESAGAPESYVCVWRKIVGNKVLRTKELPISYIPVIRVSGEMLIKDGKRVLKGLVRDARDAVRIVSYQFSAYIEAVALEPKTPYIGAKGQFDGEEDRWAMANTENLPYLEYNTLDAYGNPAPAPQRQNPPMASQGLAQGLLFAKDALKSVTGQHDASMGAQGNETSGRAILARQREGDVANYHFVDNLSKAVRHAGRILIQWIPKVYDERRVARIIGEDGEADYAELDSQQPEAVRKVRDGNGEIKRIYNLGVGCYDVLATAGPSYTTKRQESVAAMQEILRGNPELFGLIGDIFVRNQDWPGSDDMAKRLKAMLPPQALQAEQEEEDQVPPQVQAQMQQLQAHVQEGAQIVQQLQAENEQLQQQLQSKDAEVQSRLDQERIRQAGSIHIAEINADSKREVAMLAAQQADMSQRMDAMAQMVMQLAEMKHAAEMREADPPEVSEQDEIPQ